MTQGKSSSEFNVSNIIICVEITVYMLVCAFEFVNLKQSIGPKWYFYDLLRYTYQRQNIGIF